MNIVVLDGHALNPGDLSWNRLHALGACSVFARTPPTDVVARAQDAEVVLTNKARLGASELARLPRLRYVGVLATGFDVVDVHAAFERGVVVANVPAYGTPSVAQMTFALLLELCNQVGHHAEAARLGRWSQSGEFSYREHPLHELAGMTFGIVGLGRIGRAVAAIASAFQMQVIATSSSRSDGAGVQALVPLDELFARADVASLHCPLTPSTVRMVDAARLSRMKPHAFLINTARGGLIDESALLDALVQGRIGGAALDVLTVEPPAPDHPLLSAPRCIVTPHMAWATRASRERLLSVAIDNVEAFMAGSPRNVVSGLRPA